MAGLPRRPRGPGRRRRRHLAVTGRSLVDLRERLSRLLPSCDELAEPPEPAGIVIHRLESAGNAFTVAREDGVLVGPRPPDRAPRRPDQLRQSRSRRNDSSATWSASASTASCAARAWLPGDTVRIGANELEWGAEAWDDR